MFRQNEGKLDRVLRIVVGLALIAGYFAMPETAYRWAFILGLVPLATGLIGSCPLYSILGIGTCPAKKA